MVADLSLVGRAAFIVNWFAVFFKQMNLSDRHTWWNKKKPCISYNQRTAAKNVSGSLC